MAKVLNGEYIKCGYTMGVLGHKYGDAVCVYTLEEAIAKEPRSEEYFKIQEELWKEDEYMKVAGYVDTEDERGLHKVLCNWIKFE